MTKGKPNRVTEFAVGHPLLYSFVTAILVALLALGTLSSVGKTAVLLGAVIGGLGMFLLNIILWRDGGAGARWYRRSTGVRSEAE
jgi:predicted permease